MTAAPQSRDLYKAPTKHPELIDVPAMLFLMVDGTGDPNTAPAYQEAVESLYAVSYALKFTAKREGHDYKVAPLEGLWWVPGEAQPDLQTLLQDKRRWHWTMMIAQPGTVTEAQLETTLAEVARKKNLAALHKLRLERVHEGLAAQIMHLGRYSEELPTVERLHGFILEQGFAPSGKHHEIYLSDPRRSAPEKLRTILRQPVSKVSS